MSSVVADFDGDGIGDLLLNRAVPSSESLMFLSGGVADLKKREPSNLPVGRFGLENTKHNHVAAADIDGDGDQDIVLGQTRADPYYAGKELQVLINDGNGYFSDETDARLGDQSFYSECIVQSRRGVRILLDVNGDGSVDIFDQRVVRWQYRSTRP